MRQSHAFRLSLGLLLAGLLAACGGGGDGGGLFATLPSAPHGPTGPTGPSTPSGPSVPPPSRTLPPNTVNPPPSGGFPSTPTDVMPSTTPAPLGQPRPDPINGLWLMPDTLHRRPLHSVPVTWSALPGPLAAAPLPSISDIRVLQRRDSAILYLPAIQGAADYRAWIFDPARVSFGGAAGTQPRGAVVACAGYRQRHVRNVDVLLNNDPFLHEVFRRELMQQVEVPGLTNPTGTYTIVVEALATPCPFTGVMGHASAQVPVYDGSTFQIRGFNDVLATYGNEVLNGQGSTLTDYAWIGPRTIPPLQPGWPVKPAEPVGLPVPPDSLIAPADPLVLARSAIVVSRPAADEAANAPIFDVGFNSHWDDFGTDAVMTTLDRSREVRQEGAGHVSGGPFDDWFFWTIGVQPALTPSGSLENGVNPRGAQVWKRHGRLYTTIGDFGQDIWAGIYFSSLAAAPHRLDPTPDRYVHSFFRVDSAASQRRYWQWTMCGGATVGELVDPATNVPRGRPVGQPFFFDPAGPPPADPSIPRIAGQNPSSRKSWLGEPASTAHDKECLTLVQVGDYWQWGRPNNATAAWFDEPHSSLHAVIHPAGQAYGTINLKTSGYDDNDPQTEGGIRWRLDAAKRPTQPMFEPFDQQAPLTHFDVFVRPDRVILFINGRQAWCANLAATPLTMQYGLITYGHVLYHSNAEIETNYIGNQAFAGAVGGNFHYTMNTPWADTRVWDAVGQSESIPIPPQFTFDAATCFAPRSMVAR